MGEFADWMNESTDERREREREAERRKGMTLDYEKNRKPIPRGATPEQLANWRRENGKAPVGEYADRAYAEIERRLKEMGLPDLSALLHADTEAKGESHTDRIHNIVQDSFRDGTHHLHAADMVMELLRSMGRL